MGYPQDGLGIAQEGYKNATRWPQDAPREPKMVPRWPQDAPREPRRRPKTTLRCTKIPHLAPRGPILESTWEKGRPDYRWPPKSGPYFGVFLDHKWDPKMRRKMSLQKCHIGEPRGAKHGIRGPRKIIKKGRGGNNLRLSCQRDDKKKASKRKNEKAQKT